jgi:excisionase family DNA binding protein
VTPPADWIADVVAKLEPLTTPPEAARALRVSLTTLRRWIAAGRLKAIRPVESPSGHVRIPRLEIERFLRSLSSAE